jgi:hypothetical protein
MSLEPLRRVNVGWFRLIMAQVPRADLMSSSTQWLAPSVAAMALALGGCGGESDLDAIKKTVGDLRQWQHATVSECDEAQKGSDWPAETTFYVCDVRNLDERGFRTLGLPTQPPRIVRVCFAVQHDEHGDALLVGPVHEAGPCSKKPSA